MLRYNFLNPMSARRRAERRLYLKAKVRFLALNRWCAWGLAQEPPRHFVATQVHHTRGRSGALYLDERFFVAVSAAGHRWGHDHPEAARKLNLLCARGLWGRSEP